MAGAAVGLGVAPARVVPCSLQARTAPPGRSSMPSRCMPSLLTSSGRRLRRGRPGAPYSARAEVGAQQADRLRASVRRLPGSNGKGPSGQSGTGSSRTGRTTVSSRRTRVRSRALELQGRSPVVLGRVGLVEANDELRTVGRTMPRYLFLVDTQLMISVSSRSQPVTNSSHRGSPRRNGCCHSDSHGTGARRCDLGHTRVLGVAGDDRGNASACRNMAH